jgi:hypothetical protein
MRLMCWDVDIVHRNNIHLTDANYWSHLGADICFDPLFKSYLDFNQGLCERFSAPTSLPIKPENMPYYRGPCVTTTADSSDSGVPSTAPTADAAHQSHCQFVMNEMIHHNCHGLSHLSNVPVRFGTFYRVTPTTSHASSNHKIPTYGHQILQFNWAVYSFGGGHFVLTVLSHNLPFQVTLACDQYECGRALFREFTSCPDIFGSGNDLLHHIRASGDTLQIFCYLIHSLRFRGSNTTSLFWQLQSSIVAQLCSLNNLQLVVAVILPNHDGHHVTSFARTLNSAGWSVSMIDDVYFPSNGDTIAGSCYLLCGIHSSCTACVEPFALRPPPPLPPKPLGAYLWEPFSRPEHSVSLGRNDNDFCCQDVWFAAAEPPGNTPSPHGIDIKYYLHSHGSDKSSLNGSAVISVDGLCPQFDAGTNQKMFQHLFDIEYHFENHTHVHGISPFEFARCFGFTDNLTHGLSHPASKFSLDAAIPGQTSAWIFEQVHAYLVFVHDSNCELFSPNKWAAPAAPIQSFVNGAIGTRLPSRAR